MAEMQANNDNSQPSTPARIDDDDLNHHHYSSDDISHAHTPTTAYIINGNGVPTNLNGTLPNNNHPNYYPITNGDTKNLIIYNGNGVDCVDASSITMPITSSSTNPPEMIERIARDWGADSIDDVNAATAMLALKHGPKVFSENFQNGYVRFFDNFVNF